MREVGNEESCHSRPHLTTIIRDNKTINEAALEISLADITNVESRIVNKLVLS